MQPKRHDPIKVAEPFHGIFAHGVEFSKSNRILVLSGQVGETEEGYIPDDFMGQCRLALDNVERILKAADMTFKDIVKTNFYLTRPGDMSDLVQVRKEKINGVRPANTTLFVSQLMKPEWLVEIEVIAVSY
jgi:2-iminobutanoate/2-iminopropanoate deaminase